MSNTSAQIIKPLTYTIRVAAKLTGVNAHLIRIWERRYKAVKPVRTMTNRRLYSDKELERLSLFRQLTEAGHSIGSIATLETEQLRSLLPSAANHASRFTPVIVEPHGAESLRNGLDESAPHAAHRALDLGMDAIGRMDAAGLEAALNESVFRLGHQGFL
ncbi:MAG: MerR family transcriptional regulator, partial [Verrucomicrobia bacterium]|nr:MerR family transcriptional regulator [Verrucomicrobiota bacterium]